MQVASLDPGRSLGPHAAAGSASLARAARVTRADAPSRAEHAESAPPIGAPRGGLRGGLTRLDVELNRRIAGAQQTVEYLDRFDAQLRSLKAALARRLSQAWVESAAGEASRRAADDALREEIRRFDGLWRERPRASAGRLDVRLAFSEASDAQRRFAVQGLQMDALRSGASETLTLAIGATRAAAAVRIDPQASPDELARRFDRALGPSGVRVGLDARGELAFSVRESAWPGVRESLSIKGEGRRFPTGEFTLARTIAEPAVVQPETWKVEDPESLRRALNEIVQAELASRAARGSADRTLAAAQNRLQPREAAHEAQSEADWCARFARAFLEMAQRSDYRSLSAFSVALSGIERTRVEALLR